MRTKLLVLVAAVVVFVCGLLVASRPSAQSVPSSEPSVDKARLLHRHGLTRDAKAELIQLLFNSTDAESKAHAHYLLGSIAFGEGRADVAAESWRTLAEQYPESQPAMLVRDDLDVLAQIVEESVEGSIDDAIASTYLRHGDFWSRGKPDRFTIDSSWIANVEAALKWYDKVIVESPQTEAARRAYEEKLRTILGWEDPGRYSTKHGVQASFEDYMPLLLETFSAFEEGYPEAPTLQAFRFQIAQAYWRIRNWDKTREWLNAIIRESGNTDNFYRDLAQRRLENVEY